jgi:Mn-containing catalase
MAESFKPFEMKGKRLEAQVKNWNQLTETPYDKTKVDAYTRTRVILMNGIENNATIMAHNIARMTDDNDVKETIGHLRRLDSLQQQHVNWLNPASQSVLETTIGYELVAVDLTADLAQNEPDPYFKQVLDFALLEDFDHLFRYGCALEVLEDKDPNDITQGRTEIKAGRPTDEEHRHPIDEMRKHYDKDKADLKTKMNYHTIVSAEQQTMLFYKAHGFQYENELARRIYTEIADVEQQHVSQYEAVGDPRETMLEKMAVMELCEAYNYYSCYMSESDRRFKSLWEELLAEEIEHFNVCADLLQRKEGRDIREVLQSETIEPLIVFHENKDYVNQVLRDTLDWRPVNKEFVPLDQVPSDWASHKWNKVQNGAGSPAMEFTRLAEEQGKVPEVSRQMAGVR